MWVDPIAIPILLIAFCGLIYFADKIVTEKDEQIEILIGQLQEARRNK